jgi:CID domain
VLGKYLSALSASFDLASAKDQPAPTKPAGLRVSWKRKRLHILYLLNDVLHHTKYHTNEGVSAFVNFSSSLQPHAIELVGFAASFDRRKNPKHHRRLDQLLDVWHDHGYYGAEYLNKLRELVQNADSVDMIKAFVGPSEGAGQIQPKGSRRDAPYIMPATHGDPSTPYYDLPAGNFVPHIIPDSIAPIRPDAVKPLQFLAGPADQKLVGILKEFFQDVDRIYKSTESDISENAYVDIDELGQAVVRDEKSSEIIEGDTYYGWSRDFCLQMKKRKSKRLSSRSRSRSPGVDERGRRRRYSDSNSREYASRSPGRGRYSRSPSSNVSGEDYRPRSGGQIRSRSRSNSYSPRPASPPRSFPNSQQNFQPVPPPTLPPNPSYPFHGPASFPPQFAANIPPPPLNYNAPWPTPHMPPPIFPAGGQHIVPPGIANFPQQYQPPANQASQYGRPGQNQHPMSAFPPPWQGGGHQGGYNQGGHR